MSNKINMAEVITELPDFLNENTDLMLEKLWEATTLGSGIEKIVDQTGKFALNTLANEIYLQANTCGFNPSGSTTFGQEEVQMEYLKTDETLCAKSFYSKYASQLYNIGADGSTLPFETFIAEGKTQLLAKTIEQLFWIGDKTGSGNMSMADGIVPFLNDKGSIFASGAAAPITKANAIEKVEAMVDAIPVEIFNMSDLVIYVDPIVFRNYVNALKDSNLYTGNAVTIETYGKTIMIDGWDITMISTDGLSGTGFMYLSQLSNLVFGTDLDSDLTNVKISYYERDEVFDVKSRFAFGVGVYFPALLVHNNAAITGATTV